MILVSSFWFLLILELRLPFFEILVRPAKFEIKFCNKI